MKIISNADDFGYNNEVNLAIIDCFKRNIISNTSIMANMEASDEAVILATNNNLNDKIGLHLNLVEGKPLTENIRNYLEFCDKNGFYNDLQLSRAEKMFKLKGSLLKTLQEEIEAQIKWYLNKGFTQKHIDSHKNILVLNSIFEATMPIFLKYGFQTMRKPEYYKDKSLLTKTYYSYMDKKTINNITDTFLYGDEYLKNKNKYKNYDCIELMFHPKYIDGEIIDSVTNSKLTDVQFNNEELINY